MSDAYPPWVMAELEADEARREAAEDRFAAMLEADDREPFDGVIRIRKRADPEARQQEAEQRIRHLFAHECCS